MGFRDGYITYDEMHETMRAWADAHPEVVQLTSIGNSQAWGTSGQPERAPGAQSPTLPWPFTGIVQTAGTNGYTVSLNATLSGGSLVPITADLQISAS